jgi:acetylornithine deacetylase/succinyl-diaminopimelate desuccinylase family protein
MSENIDHRIHAAVAAQRNEAAALLAALVRIPTDNPPGDLAPAAEATAGLLEALGFTVERHAVPADLARAAGMVSATNLIVRHRFGPGPVIALNAHGDVVPPGAGWTQPPYGAAVVDGWLYGRGAAVSKSDIASYAFALHALREVGLARGTVELHVTFDEETGGALGPAWLLAQNITAPDYAICAGFSYAVVNAHNGCVHLQARITGRSAHAARPETGADALEAATAILTALYQARHALQNNISAVPGIGAPQLTIGTIAGGTNTNVVPDEVALRLDRRVIPEENPDQVAAELTALIDAAAAPFPGIAVEVTEILRAAPLTPLPAAAKLSDALARHASHILGEPVPVVGVPLYTDARHYAAAGIPVVLYGAGPRTIEEANAHRADERVRLTDLTIATEVIARAVAEVLEL